MSRFNATEGEGKLLILLDFNPFNHTQNFISLVEPHFSHLFMINCCCWWCDTTTLNWNWNCWKLCGNASLRTCVVRAREVETSEKRLQQSAYAKLNLFIGKVINIKLKFMLIHTFMLNNLHSFILSVFSFLSIASILVSYLRYM